jgi:hypothetical protein
MIHRKKILFIAPKFAGYENELIEAMENNGYKVDYFPEKLYGKYSILVKNLSNSYFLNLQKNYLNELLAITKNKEYDYLIVIRGEILDELFLDRLYAQTDIKYKINYQWDSVATNRVASATSHLYDKVYSFDRKDCNEYKFIYKPLFFIQKYINENENLKNDLLFIGTEHGERIKYINIFKKYCIENNLKFKVVLYTSFYKFIKNKIFNKDFNGMSLSDVIFKKISIQDSYKLVSQSYVVLDVANIKQSGLTMRTIETLGANRKLITNNQYIEHDTFFNQKIIKKIEDSLDIQYFNESLNNINTINTINTINNIKKLEINGWVNEFFKNI